MNEFEINIVDKAITKFEEEAGLRLTPYFYDKHVDIQLSMDDNKILFVVEIKTNINRTKLALINEKLKTLKGIPLLITDYLAPELIDNVKELGMNFIDTEGNAFIYINPLYILLKGNKLRNIQYRNTGTTFNTKTLQTIYAFLCNPGLEQNTIREIGQFVNVATGTAHIALKELERQGFLLNKTNTGRKIINKELLLKKWVTLYPEKLKNKFYFGRFQADDTNFVEKTDVTKFGGLWGGETAAAKTTNYLTPLMHTIYIGERQGEFIIRNKLKKNQNGNIEIINKFWRFDDGNQINGLVNPILIYADLLATGNPRNLETAKIIYEREVIRYIGKN